jgi:transposase
LHFIAIERHRDGEPVAEIAASLGVSAGAVYAWIRKHVSQAGSLSGSCHAAEPLAIPHDVSMADKIRLYEMLDCATPRDYGFDTDLWSRFVVSALLELEFGISLDPVSTERLLETLGFPVDACIRADLSAEQATMNNLSETRYRSELRRARKRGADLLFWHEGWWNEPQRRVASAPRVDDPGVEAGTPHSQARQIAWAVNGKGGFWFCTHRGERGSPSSLTNLQSMMRHRSNPCYVITSDSRLLSDPELRAFAASTGNRLVLCQSNATTRRSSCHTPRDRAEHQRL